MRKTLLGLLVTLLVTGLAPFGRPAGAEPDRKDPMVAARQRFFGKENVNPKTGAVRADRVIMSWFSVSSYATALNGHVVLVDGWISRGSHSGYVPTTTEEVAALDPEYIFIGHGDFDHAADVAAIAAKTGAPLVGGREHCDQAREHEGDKVKCILATSPDATPGFVKELDLIPGVEITAVTHIHSSFESPEQQDGGRLPCLPVWNAGDTVEHPPSPEDMQHFFNHFGDARGANILYQFRIGRFALTWHDTTGKLKEDAPQVIKRLKALPETDVHSGAILAFGQVTNCFRSLRMYLDALQPKVFAANHHDNFTWFLGANAEDLEPYVRAEIDSIPEKRRPELLYTYDPDDYLNPEPFTFDPTDKRWR